MTSTAAPPPPNPPQSMDTAPSQEHDLASVQYVAHWQRCEQCRNNRHCKKGKRLYQAWRDSGGDDQVMEDQT